MPYFVVWTYPKGRSEVQEFDQWESAARVALGAEQDVIDELGPGLAELLACPTPLPEAAMRVGYVGPKINVFAADSLESLVQVHSVLFAAGFR